MLMDELGKHINEKAQILFGTVVDTKFKNKISVTLLSSTRDANYVGQLHSVPVRQMATEVTVENLMTHPIIQPERVEELQLPIEPVIHQIEPSTFKSPEEQEAESEEIIEVVTARDKPATVEVAKSTEIELPMVASDEKPETTGRSRQFAFPIPSAPILQTPASAGKKATSGLRQETLQFEPATRGRFDKSEPTIVDGQDLDIPTFLRLKVKVK